VGRLGLAPTSGRPLPRSVAEPIGASFGVDVSDVRVHTDAPAASAAASLKARAFTLGNRIMLGRGERPTDLKLMAHEVAHVVQQRGAAVVQRFTNLAGDAKEREAQRAAAAAVRGRPFSVTERTEPRVQRLGIGDALDYFADKANIIPGFRMLTILLGVNPINMSKVDRSAANILRAIVEFIPGGALITQALDNYGVFEKVGNWIEEQLRTLGLSWSTFKQAIDKFLDSLSWTDIFDLGGVWDRAKKIFTEPIGKLIAFAGTLLSGILRFVREAVLKPLAKLAEGTRGWDLLKAVLGEDPITGEPVPRTAETLIGGFMKLIGQEEVWENIKKANAIPRAWAWFQGAMKELLAFVRQIPSRFVAALQSLEIADFVLLPRLFMKVGSVFAGFIGDFLSWALKQVLSLLQIIFEVLAPSVMPYIRKAMGAFKTIIANPVGFVGNLVKAGVTGLEQFAKNFLAHLRTALIQWITGALSGANLYIPQAFEIREIIKFVLSVLGLTWASIRGKLVKVIGETAVTALETGFDIVVTLVKQGPAAAWEKIKEQLTNLKEMVMEQVMTFVRDKIVQAAITRLVTSLNPAGAFIQAVLAIYNTIMFVVERLRQIGQVVAAFIDSIAAIAAGAIGAAANRVEQTMAGLLTLVISFLARLVGLGKVSDAVVNIVNKIRAPIDKALDKVVEWVVNTAKKIGKLLSGRGGGPTVTAGQADVERSVKLAHEPHVVRAHVEGPRLQILMSSGSFKPVEEEIEHVQKHIVDTYLGGAGASPIATDIAAHLAVLRKEKDAWAARYVAAPEPQKAQVINDGMTHFAAQFATLNQYLEQFIGPWATVRIGDTVSYTSGARTDYATVTEIMNKGRVGLGIKARPAWEKPGGRRLTASEVATWQEIAGGARSGAGEVVLAYSWYGTRWQRVTGNVPLLPGSRQNPFLLDWPKPAWDAYPTLYFAGLRAVTPQAALRLLPGATPFPPSGGSLGGNAIGIQPPYRVTVGTVVGPLVNRTTPGGEKLIKLLRPYGFDPDLDQLQADHVHEVQLGGPDVVHNLWPLPAGINRAAGPTIAGARVRFRDGSGTIALKDLKRLTDTEFYFEIAKVK
jgi:hypothetical protein